MDDQLQLGFAKYFKDAYIVIEGKPNTGCFFIIQQGRVRIFKERAVGGERDELLGPGDFFGVISTMSSQNHIDTAQALTDVVLIKVYKHQYVGLIQKSAPIAIKIIKQFSQRLRNLNQTLARLTLKNSSDDDPSHLYNVAEYYYKQRQTAQAFYTFTKYVKYNPGGENLIFAKGRLAELAKHQESVKTDYGAQETNRTYRKDAMIFAEGEPGNELFVIQKGSVKIAKIADNNEMLLAVLNAGDIFGEMAILEGKPRAASAIAYGDCQVMAINKANFELMTYSQPQLISRVTTLLSERLWLVYKQLVNAGIINPLGRMYDALVIQLEKNRIPLYVQAPYTFSFGPDELFNMVGLNRQQGRSLLAGMLRDKRIEVVNDKIHTNNVKEIIKLAEYYQKMDRREKFRGKR